MKIYCSRINKFPIDIENGNGDLEALQYFLNTNYWVLTLHACNIDVYEKIKDIEGGRYLCDIITIEYPTYEEYEEYEEFVDNRVRVRVDYDVRNWINKYGTFIRPFQMLTDEEVQEFINTYDED